MKFPILLFFFVLPLAIADLRVGFYSSTCPRAEDIVRQIVERNFFGDRSITGGLLRLHFHDCFVRGCDASILIDSTSENASEKAARANKSVRGYEIIDEIKRSLEETCPLTVSCADIIALATRDSVALSGGPRYIVPTGRRDGLVSNSGDVNLPGPDLSVSNALKAFTAKGMTLNEMVTLLGAHTVGFTHCHFIRDRLNDPTMDPPLRAVLMRLCGSRVRGDPTVFLDQSTAFVFDNQFYDQMLRNRGVLFLDQQLALDPSSRDLVLTFARNHTSFLGSFIDAVIKMGGINVLVGNQGEIRKNCRVFNNPL